MNLENKDDHVPLTPIINFWMSTLMKNKTLLCNSFTKYGSPVNIHCIDPFNENLDLFVNIMDRYSLKYRVYFARKANKCLSFAKESARKNQGIDTASYRELKQCLDAGIPADQLILTAAVKNKNLLELAVKHKVTIIVDNLDEMNLLREVTFEKQSKVNVNIRLGGFKSNGKSLYSRFGFSLSEAFELIQEIQKSEQWICYSGIHFHLNGYLIEDRAQCIEQCIELIDMLLAKGVKTESLDIGGGYLVNYLKDKDEWEVFHHELRNALNGKRNPITFQNDGLGIFLYKDQLIGVPQVYPYYSKVYKEAFLEKILTSYSEKHKGYIHELVRDRDLELRMEPGRSLLDQTGLTAATVAFRKVDSEGNLLIGLEMNRTQLRSSSADFLLDPVHIPMKSVGPSSNKRFFGYLVGAYCLEQEFILKRRIRFEQFPEVGDFFIFPNTAGYMMHFYESEAHQFKLAVNLFYSQENNTLTAD